MWDEAKAASNFAKHGISFKLAITAFDDPHALIALDDQHYLMEQREWLIGQSDKGVLVVSFHPPRFGNDFESHQRAPCQSQRKKTLWRI